VAMLKGRKAPVPVKDRTERPWRALGIAVGVALLVTVGAWISVAQTLSTKTQTETVWLTTRLIPGGSVIRAGDLQKTEVPASLTGVLYTGKAPLGKSVTVTVVKGTVLQPGELGTGSVAIPSGEIGVWVATTPAQDGSITVGQLVIPYLVPQAGSANQASAQPLVSNPVMVVALSDQSGNLDNGVGGSSSGSSALVTGSAPAAVEIAVPVKAASAVVAAAANRTVVLAAPGGVQ